MRVCVSSGLGPGLSTCVLEAHSQFGKADTTPTKLCLIVTSATNSQNQREILWHVFSVLFSWFSVRWLVIMAHILRVRGVIRSCQR